MAKAEINARVAKVSAIVVRDITDPLALHKQQERETLPGNMVRPADAIYSMS